MNATRWKILLGIFFGIAVFWGLFQRQFDPYASSSRKAYTFQRSVAEDRTLTQYYQEGVSLGKNPTSPSKISFVAVGDIMLSRNVAQKIKEAKDPAAPFKNISSLLQTVDFSFGNLESPIIKGQGTAGGHSMVFAAGEDVVPGLVQNKFKVLNLANNHALDQGLLGLNATTQILDAAGIKHVGVGIDSQTAWTVAKQEQNGIVTCFIGASYASINDNGKTTNAYVARIEDVKELKLRLADLKPACDFIIVTMHAGTEYTRQPNKAQTAFARAAIDEGADMVIGAHPHWIQTVEKYQNSPANPSCKKSSFDNPITIKDGVKYQSLDLGEGCAGKYIFYSLGNFVFDQMWSQETRQGLVLKINLTKPAAQSFGPKGPKIRATLENIELLPVIIEDYSSPRLADGNESQEILEKIGLNEKILY